MPPLLPRSANPEAIKQWVGHVRQAQARAARERSLGRSVHQRQAREVTAQPLSYHVPASLVQELRAYRATYHAEKTEASVLLYALAVGLAYLSQHGRSTEAAEPREAGCT